jgi:TM2 domain-containing membrane protein YozV
MIPHWSSVESGIRLSRNSHAIITWLMALPTSSSHAIISGYAGAAIAKAGFKVILLKGWIPVILFLIISPIIGMILGWAIMTSVAWLTRRSERYKTERRFRHLQLLSAGLYSLGHGTNDAQKTMGIIVALLAGAGHAQWSKASHSGFQGLAGKHEIAWWINRRSGLRSRGDPRLALSALDLGREDCCRLGAHLPRSRPHRSGWVCLRSLRYSTVYSLALGFDSRLGFPLKLHRLF